ncbi:MAG: rhodanese-like domain-containing protein [Oligoflexia bacterium]|nr:rhodanese-like domain-containing protein [Oligoflexia bacterium]
MSDILKDSEGNTDNKQEKWNLDKINIFRLFELIDIKISDLEKKISQIEERFEVELSVQRDHLLRVKNGEKISSQFISEGLAYSEFTAESAYKIYQDGRYNFIIIDVSIIDFVPPTKIDGVLHIPLEDLNDRYKEFANKLIPMFFISEDGTRSILAVEQMNKLGFFNVNNISGGHQFWPGHHNEHIDNNKKNNNQAA